MTERMPSSNDSVKGYIRLSGAPAIPKQYKPYVLGSSDNNIPDTDWYMWKKPKRHYATEIFQPKTPDMTEEYNSWIHTVKMNRLSENKRAEVHETLQKNRKDVLVDTLTKGIKQLEDDKLEQQLLASGILDPEVADNIKRDRNIKLAQLAVEKGLPVDVTKAYKVNKAIYNSLPVDLKAMASASPDAAAAGGPAPGSAERSPLHAAVDRIFEKTLPVSWSMIEKPLTAAEFESSEYFKNRERIKTDKAEIQTLIKALTNQRDAATNPADKIMFQESIDQLTFRRQQLDNLINKYGETFDSMNRRIEAERKRSEEAAARKRHKRGK